MSSSGWGSSYTPSTYGSSLADQLTGSANYDPTQQQSTSNQTSAARTFGSQDGPTTAATYLQPVAGSLQQAAAQAAGATSPTSWLQPFAGNLNANTAAPSPMANNWASMGNAMQNVSQTPVPSGAAPPAANALQYSYSPQAKMAIGANANRSGGATAVGNYTPVSTTGAANSNGVSLSTGAPGVAYTGNKVVAVQGSFGVAYYYKWDPTSGQYVFAGTNNSGLGGGASTGQSVNGGSSGSNFDPLTGLSVADENKANVVAANGINQKAGGGDAASLAYINQTQQNDITAYRDAVATYNANQAAQSAAAAVAGKQAQAAAAAQAAQDKLNPFAPQLAAVDTSAVDATNAAAQSSLNSLYASSGGGADGAYMSRLGSANAAALTGQAKLAHDSDYAAKFDSNMGTFAQALTNQYTADANASGAKLSTDIQVVGDTLNQLSQQASQLDQATQLKVGSAINQLQQQVQQYQLASQSYGQASSQAMQIAQAILQGGASLTASITKAAV